ncbi:MAG: inositol monophosphatase [Candidatus Brocadiia bacterium]
MLESFTGVLVRDAGAIALRRFRSSPTRTKSDGTVVTDADREIEDYIRQAVATEFPNSTFIGEEGEIEEGSGLTWFVDPIDGTSMYSVGGPTWSVAVTVFDGDTPLCSIVHCPLLGETFHTSGRLLLLNGEAVRSRPFESCRETVLYAPSNFHTNYLISRYAGKTRNLGSGCIHQAYVFSGRGDAAILRGHAWDIASGLAFISVAGGVALDLSSKPFTVADLLALGKRKTVRPVIFAPTEGAASFFRERISYSEQA